MNRYLFPHLQYDLKKKMVLLSGPRQVGKTTLARALVKDHEYLNWDISEDRASILKKEWDRSRGLVIFDELHKMKNFKAWLKGIYDKEANRPAILVTGSARLDIAKRMGDSLAGRFFPYRLHPLDLWELREEMKPEKAYARLMSVGGFPEPFFEGSESYHARWSKTHLDLILRQDLLDLESIRNIGAIETLVALLQDRVGSTVSYSSLGRDLQVDPKTVKSWLDILENLFVVFKVTPYHRNIARALVKEPKYYFYDLARVRSGEGARLENLVALATKKQLDYLGDAHGKFGALHFLRNRSHQEVDFLIQWERKGISPILIEVKLSDGALSPHFQQFKKYFSNPRMVQLVRHLDREKTYPTGEKVRSVVGWLTEMSELIGVS